MAKHMTVEEARNLLFKEKDAFCTANPDRRSCRDIGEFYAENAEACLKYQHVFNMVRKEFGTDEWDHFKHKPLPPGARKATEMLQSFMRERTVVHAIAASSFSPLAS